MQTILKGDTRPILFFMTQSSDHITGYTGSAPTVTISQNGGAFASPTGSVSQLANGWWILTPLTADTNVLGAFLIHATAASADPADAAYQVVAVSPYDSVRAGLTALPNVAAGAAGGLPLGDASGNSTLSATTQNAIAAAAATDILTTPANKLATDGSGNVSLASATETAIGAAAATAILVTPSNKITTDSSGNVAANNLVTGLLDLANGVETSVTLRQALRLCAAALGGVLSGGDGTTVTIQAANNAGTNRITATVDANGNRTAVTLAL